MKQAIIYALDFDGVLCDSALETGMAGWKAATQTWPELLSQDPAPYIQKFRASRAILETGYESILIMYMLFHGETAESILSNFPTLKTEVLAETQLEINDLKKLFGSTRDQWISAQLDEWVRLNPLFPGVADRLRNLVAQNACYVLTTKQERFVYQILQGNHIDLNETRIFGMDRNITKDQVLIDLLAQHPDEKFFFVEDRLPALVSVMQNPQLQRVNLRLAEWGYNTAHDREEAKHLGLSVINLEEFITLA